MTAILLSGVVLALAAANGANDQLKGVATLLGSGATGFRVARIWATASTLAGALLATFLGARLAAQFSGNGLVPSDVLAQPGFLVAIGIAAALTVAIAARTGMPVSTTHALLGALVGAGLLAARESLVVGVLVKRFVLPLVLSPLLAAAISALGARGSLALARARGRGPHDCICFEPPRLLVANTQVAASVLLAPAITTCRAHGSERAGRLTLSRVVAAAHFMMAGLVGFARGLNDTPKIAALWIGAGVGSPGAFVLVALFMAVGGWWGARPVGRTMSVEITPVGSVDGLIATTVTAGLVLAASTFALPVSMTHVAVGALAGVGAASGGARWGTLRRIALAWFTTLPLAAALAALSLLLLRRFPL